MKFFSFRADCPCLERSSPAGRVLLVAPGWRRGYGITRPTAPVGPPEKKARPQRSAPHLASLASWLSLAATAFQAQIKTRRRSDDGAPAVYGQQMKNGAEIAVADIDAKAASFGQQLKDRRRRS